MVRSTAQPVAPARPVHLIAPERLNDPTAPLTLAQERQLGWLMINDGCQSSRDLLVRANLGLVHEIAGNYSRLGTSVDELVERGTVGLRLAVDHYDPAHGTRFSTMAAWWIKQEMRKIAVKPRPAGNCGSGNWSGAVGTT